MVLSDLPVFSSFVRPENPSYNVYGTRSSDSSSLQVPVSRYHIRWTTFSQCVRWTISVIFGFSIPSLCMHASVNAVAVVPPFDYLCTGNQSLNTRTSGQCAALVFRYMLKFWILPKYCALYDFNQEIELQSYQASKLQA